MTLDKTHLIVFIVGAVLGILTGFFTGKAIYDKPVTESITRDTVRITDTIPHYYPQAVDGTVVKYITKFLPIVRTDTVTDVSVVNIHDTVAVEVPIESRHYHAHEYDAWVSGYEPSLDSIKVYKETQYITETITKIKTPNKVGVDVIGGIDYNIEQKEYIPFALGEFSYKQNRFEFGIRGGVEKHKKLEVKVGGFVKVRVF